MKKIISLIAILICLVVNSHMVYAENNYNVIRLGGNDRYGTSLNVCKYFNLHGDTAVIANGQNFPDALSGSALAAQFNAPIILTDGKDISNQKKII